MKSEWKLVYLKDVCSIKNGYAFKSRDFCSQGVPVIKIKNVKPNQIVESDFSYIPENIAEEKSNWLISKGDILLTMSGNRVEGSPESWVGKAALFNLNGKYLLNQRVSAIRSCSKELDTEYLGYYLSSWESQLYFVKHSNSSGGQANISPAVVKEYQILLPPINEQRYIVSILRSLDGKIALNNKINDNLEQQAEALFSAWFIDFKLWNNIKPSSWRQAPLGTFVTIKRGGSPRPIQEFLSDSGFRWLKISDATSLNGPFVLSIKEHIKEEGLRKTVFLKAGSLVLSNSATPGIPKILDVDSCIHDGWLYFPESQFSNYYLYLLFKHIRKDLVSLGNGSIFTNLKTDILKGFDVIRPDDETLKTFDSVIKPIFEEILNLERENCKLEAIRDTLLPKLMSGEIDVTDTRVL